MLKRHRKNKKIQVSKPSLQIIFIIMIISLGIFLFIDTDKDELSNYSEIFIHKTAFNSIDTDGDGLTDGEEIKIFNTNPKNKDTDNDGLDDKFEVTTGTLINSIVPHQYLRLDCTRTEIKQNEDVLHHSICYGFDVDTGLFLNTSKYTEDERYGWTLMDKRYNTFNPLIPDSDNDGIVDGAEVCISDNGYCTDGCSNDNDCLNILDNYQCDIDKRIFAVNLDECIGNYNKFYTYDYDKNYLPANTIYYTDSVSVQLDTNKKIAKIIYTMTPSSHYQKLLDNGTLSKSTFFGFMKHPPIPYTSGGELRSMCHSKFIKFLTEDQEYELQTINDKTSRDNNNEKSFMELIEGYNLLDFKIEIIERKTKQPIASCEYSKHPNDVYALKFTEGKDGVPIRDLNCFTDFYLGSELKEKQFWINVHIRDGLDYPELPYFSAGTCSQYGSLQGGGRGDLADWY